LSAESFGKLDSINNGQNALKRLCPPLISGAFTTIIAFFPLVFMPMVSKMVIAIALSTAVVTFVSMILALWLCPPLFLWKTSKHNTTKIHIINSASLLSGFVSRINIHIEILKKIFMKILYNCIKKPHYVCIITLFILVVGLGSIILSKTNIDEPRSENSLFAQIEFPGGFRKEIIDNHLSEWSKKIKAYDGITNVQTSVSIGSASVLINFLPNIIKNENIREIVRNEPIPEGFIYINEAASNEKLWEIKIFGNSPEQCAEIAQEAANICSAIPAVKQTVYNFKDGSPYLFIEPDRERIAVQQYKNGFSFMQISQEVRNNIFGPVIYKKLDNNGDMAAEKDVRIKGLGILSPSRDDIDKILITSPYNDTNIKLNTFVEKNYKTNKSSLRRENRRSLASISIRTKPEDPRKIRNLIMPKLSAIDLPQSYSIEFDREAVEKAELLSGTVYYFILSMLFCYIIIAISNESFLLPIAILSIIPPSVAIPMFVLFLLGFSFNTVSACAFIAVCGVAVNAAVLISDEIKVRFSNNTLTNELNRNRKYLILFGAIRKRIPNLLATSITTISSSIPYLFLNEGINLTIKTLSLISALGVAASFIFAIFFIPALAVLFPGFFAVKETK
jgi:multidrug efflux pump subunit AcrB